MIFERLIVEVREGVVGRPEREDLTFWWRNGELRYDGPTISPSAYSKFKECEHKWGLYAIDKVPQKEKPSTSLGKEAHSYLEAWELEGKPPPPTPIGLRMLNSGVLEHFPQPGTEGLQVEQVFAFAFAPTTGDPPVVFWGYKDVELFTTVSDLKSTGDMRWAKTPQELREDPQGIIYAADNMLQTGEHSAHLKWVYFTTKGRTECQPTEVEVHWEYVYRRLCFFYPLALRMTAYRLDDTVRGADLARNAAHCSAFGGCDYMDLCRPHLGAGSVLRAKRKQTALAEQRKEQEEMADPLSMIKNKMVAAGKSVPAVSGTVPVNKPAAKAPPAAAKAPPVAAKAPPVAAKAPVATKPAGAVTPPRTGRLAAAVSGVGTAPAKGPAKGVRPPDAPPATAEGDPEEGLAEGEEEQEPEEQEEQEPEEQPAAPPPKAPPRVPPKAPPAKAPPQAPPAKAPPKAPPVKAAPPPAPEEPAVTTVERGTFTLLIDVTVVAGEPPQHLADVVAPLIAQLEADAGMPYRLIDYNRGPSMLAAMVAEVLPGLEGVWAASSMLTDREVLEVVSRGAGTVLKG